MNEFVRSGRRSILREYELRKKKQLFELHSLITHPQIRMLPHSSITVDSLPKPLEDGIAVEVAGMHLNGIRCGKLTVKKNGLSISG